MGSRKQGEHNGGGLKEMAGIAAIVIVAALVLYATGIGCPIKFLTGVSCPGCGLTRAWFEALQGNLLRAVAYHPLFWTVPVIIVLACTRSERYHRVIVAALFLAIVAFIVLWAWRLAMPADTALLVDAGTVDDVVNVSRPGWLQLFS